MTKGFKITSLFKTRKISAVHPILGNLQGKESVLILEKVLFEGYQFTNGVKGIYSNTQDFNESINEYHLPSKLD